MPPRRAARVTRARMAQLANARESRRRQRNLRRPQLDARRFAFSILTNGANYKTVADIFLWNDLKIPCRSSIYKAQNEFLDKVKEHCMAIVQEWREQMESGSVIAFDGSCGHRRGAKECVVVLIDCRTRRIVDFEIVVMDKKGRKGNYNGSSNGMEVFGLKAIIERWKEDPRVVGCVHDNDSKATKAIRDAGWNIEQYYDPNHVSKALKRRWDKSPHGHLKGIQGRLFRWFHYLIRSDYSPAERRKYWLNALEHFKGNHADCPLEHPTLQKKKGICGQAAENKLQDFLEATVSLVERTRGDFHQQMCESFNAVKAKFASKTMSWKVSWPIRVMCAVMQTNCDEDWRIPLAEKCELELSDEIKERLQKNYGRAKLWNELRRDPERQKQVRIGRNAARNASSRNQAGASDYHMPRGEAEVRGQDPDEPEEVRDGTINVIDEADDSMDESDDVMDEPGVGDATDDDEDGPDGPLMPFADAVSLDPSLAECDRIEEADTETNWFYVVPPGQRCRLQESVPNSDDEVDCFSDSEPPLPNFVLIPVEEEEEDEEERREVGGFESEEEEERQEVGGFQSEEVDGFDPESRIIASANYKITIDGEHQLVLESRTRPMLEPGTRPMRLPFIPRSFPFPPPPRRQEQQEQEQQDQEQEQQDQEQERQDLEQHEQEEEEEDEEEEESQEQQEEPEEGPEPRVWVEERGGGRCMVTERDLRPGDWPVMRFGGPPEREPRRPRSPWTIPGINPFRRRKIRRRFRGNLPVEIIGDFMFHGELHYRVRFQNGTFGAIGGEFVIEENVAKV
jgi:hypothetical protein